MGYELNQEAMQKALDKWKEDYIVYAPKLMAGEGMYTDVDVVRYQEIEEVADIELEAKSDYSFKEIFLPLTQTLFYYTEEQVKEANPERKNGALIFLRSCDLHAVRRLDEIYLLNGAADPYYQRLRDHTKFIVMGCKSAYENCFCVSMGTNTTDSYDLSICREDENYQIDCKWPEAEFLLKELCIAEKAVEPVFVKSNEIQVKIPESLSLEVAKSALWNEYDERCIACGRCNFVCPTCTCFTMQDIFYTDNGKVGERRRVQASCMVDGYTDVAGGGSYRQKNGQRMRFKVLHKVYDYKQRFGYHMCTGCGRCDDVCPEYISYANCINKLEDAMEEVVQNEK